MTFSDIKPFIRYAHYIPLTADTKSETVKPYDNRLFYAYRRGGKIVVQNKTYNLDKGDLALIPSGFKYRLLPPEKDATYIGINFDYTDKNSNIRSPIPPTESQKYDPRLRLEDLRFSDFPELQDVIFIKGAESLSEKLLTIEQEYSKKLLCFEEVTSSIMKEIIAHILRALHRQKFTESTEQMKNILGYINEFYYASLSNENIAEKFGLHKNYVSSLVKSYTGMPLHQYLLHIRISHSIDMLNRANKSIGEIAESCGFSDVYHFSKTFKKITGVSPSKYL